MLSLLPAAFVSLLFAQVGPFTPGAQPVSPLPPEILDRQRSPARRPPIDVSPPKPQTELDRCLALVAADPLQAITHAQGWRQQAKGVPAAQAAHCLGVAQGRLERWREAEETFLAARDLAGPGDPAYRARLGAMAGNAALAGGDAEAALAALTIARGDAAGDPALAGDIAIDRARALVALGRGDDAATALAEARAAVPGDAQAWLLSATLSRRMGKLAEAQAQIEKAAALAPVDPEVGLEAGVIAMLAGREDAARKSWQSVVDAAPKSDAAATARSYIAQLGPNGAQTP